MTRTMLALVLGVLIGVGATFLLAPSSLPPRQSDSRPSIEPAATRPIDIAAPPAAQEASRDFYRQLADADAEALASMIAQAAARAPSTDRELALAVLFKRYAELDALGAVRLARQARVGGAALGAVYGAWARAAPDQVLAALSTVTNAEDAADVAVAVIMALGADGSAVRRVTAVLAAREESTSFAGLSPQPVPTPAGPLSAIAGRSALALAAERWADLDPRRALAVARDIDDQRIRPTFEAAALRSLANVAPNEAFAGLADIDTSGPNLPLFGTALVELARADPERLLAAVRDFPPDARRLAESAALQQLAQSDPAAALRHIERLPLGMERQGFMRLVARSYGKRDATAALAWAREQRGEQMLVSAVIGGVAEDDPGRALDLALALGSPMERMTAVQMAATMGARQDATAEAMANRLLAADDPAMKDMLGFTVVAMWASRSPDRAMEWLLANGQDMSPNAFQQIGQQLAMRDPQKAVTYLARMPEPAREPWVHGVVQGYAQNDPQAAIDWLGRFRGEPWYGRAASTVAMNLAQRDGAAAARLFDDLTADAGGVPPEQLVNVIATGWANQDPAAAADWVMRRTSEPQRDLAIRNVVGMWAAQDADGARQWTLRLPQGAVRDAALAAALTASAMQRAGNLDPGLLNAFASPQAQQQSVLQIVQQLAYDDPTKARAIADAHLDATFRARADGMIEAARNQPRFGVQGVEVGVGVVQGAAPAVRGR